MSAGFHTIGLGHTLPIYNPILLAERMAQILQCNIYITTSKSYIGDYQLSESSSSTKITLPHTIHYGNGSGATSMLVILENGLRLLNKEISLKELASKTFLSIIGAMNMIRIQWKFILITLTYFYAHHYSLDGGIF